MRYIVEVLCSGMGFAQSKYGADTLPEAETARKDLILNAAAWVNSEAPKTTRIRDTTYGTTFSRHDYE